MCETLHWPAFLQVVDIQFIYASKPFFIAILFIQGDEASVGAPTRRVAVSTDL